MIPLCHEHRVATEDEVAGEDVDVDAVATESSGKIDMQTTRLWSGLGPELEQLALHYRSSFVVESRDDAATVCRMSVAVTDPDFPFDLAALNVRLHVPATGDASPTLTVLNEDLPAELRKPVEVAFAQRARSNVPRLPLLGLLQWLDKNLESLLSGRHQQSSSVKFVRNTSRPETATPPAEKNASAVPPRCDPQQLQQRATEIAQIERRFRTSFRATQSSPVTASTGEATQVPTVLELTLVPTDPDFPFILESILLRIAVPITYPTHPPTVTLLNETVDAQLKARITRRTLAKSECTPGLKLLHLLNWVDRHLEALLRDAKIEAGAVDDALSAASAPHVSSNSNSSEERQEDSEVSLHDNDDDDTDEQTLYGFRTMRMTSSDDSDASSSDDESSNDASSESAEEQAETSATTTTAAAPPPLRGTQIRLPDCKLENVALLECTSLSLLVQCMRCKNPAEIKGIQPEKQQSQAAGLELKGQSGKSAVCGTCSATLSCTFFASLLHPTSLNLGTVSTVNCAVLDVLLASGGSTFTPTCGGCTTAFASGYKGTSALSRGLPVTLVCRECHTRMTVCIDTVRFVKIGGGGQASNNRGDDDGVNGLRLKKKKRTKEDGIVPGQPLPKEGRCKHYGKSYRWFRFPCCSRAFPCDICHREGSADNPRCHEAVLANRMVCGFCSKEQPLPRHQASTDVTCSFCHASLNKRQASGFWEGGKGTRDKARMSNKERRKYVNSLLKTKSAKSERVGPKKKKTRESS
ncbi:hypothetical protein RI367_004660 [Sorochytrium milnesiophthora]